MREDHKRYREANREKRRAYDEQWRKAHRDYWRGYQNKRLQTDVSYRLRNYFSREVRRAIRKGGGSVFKLLGYSMDELRQHLQSLFQPGMTWENYGTEWHIDHVIPPSWFEFESYDDPEFRLCWSLQNLQPMWKDKNLEKSNRYVFHVQIDGIRLRTREEFREILERYKREGGLFICTRNGGGRVNQSNRLLTAVVAGFANPGYYHVSNIFCRNR